HSASGADGIYMQDSATDNVIQGNLIGTDATGSVALGNGRDAVLLNDPNVQHNLIGGPAAGAGNVLSAGSRYGVYLRFANNNTVQGNYIGTDKTGSVALGSEVGVAVFSGSGNLIGGTAAGAGNVISGNQYEGIDVGDYFGVDASAAANNTI